MFETREVFNSEIMWVHFEKYEICVNSDDQDCIIPVKDSAIRNYNPFEHSTPSELLRDFLSIEMVIPENFRHNADPLFQYDKWDENVKRNVNNAILEFVKKYGLLGLFLKDYESRLTEISNYIEGYFPRESYLTYFKRLPKSFQENDKFDEYRLQPIENKKFWYGYAEPVVSILTHIKLISNKMNIWNDFIHSKAQPYDYMPNSNKTWEEKINEFGVGPIYLFMSFYDVWQYKWNYNSLIDAMGIMVINNCINKESQVRICEDPRCKKPFISTNPKQTFHSKQCAGKYRQDKLRGKV